MPRVSGAVTVSHFSGVATTMGGSYRKSRELVSSVTKARNIRHERTYLLTRASHANLR